MSAVRPVDTLLSMRFLLRPRGALAALAALASFVAWSAACTSFDASGTSAPDLDAGSLGANDAGSLEDASSADDAAIERPVVAAGSAGGAHGCVVVADGELRCWGSNRLGELGLPLSVITEGCSASCAPKPRVVPVGKVKSVVTGLYTTCAIRTNDQLVCMGSSTLSLEGSPTALEPFNPLPTPKPVVDVTLGPGMGCALVLEDALTRGYCWGVRSSFGPLPPVMGEQVPLWTRVRVPALDGAKQVRMGTLRRASKTIPSICAIASDDSVFCWAEELGSTSSAPVKIDDGTTRFRQIGVGRESGCGVTTDGAMRCWGLNTFDQLGSVQEPITPRRSFPVDADVASWDSVSLTHNHACGLSGGNLWCWGWNGYNQIGQDVPSTACPERPTEACVSKPQPVTSVGPVRAVYAGAGHTVIVGADNRLYAMGANEEGRTGHVPQSPPDQFCASTSSLLCTPKPEPID